MLKLRSLIRSSFIRLSCALLREIQSTSLLKAKLTEEDNSTKLTLVHTRAKEMPPPQELELQPSMMTLTEKIHILL
jgi:hypothetical protein